MLITTPLIAQPKTTAQNSLLIQFESKATQEERSLGLFTLHHLPGKIDYLFDVLRDKVNKNCWR